MGYSLRMSEEIGEWLEELRASDPAAALKVGQVLAALMTEGADAGPLLGVPVAPGDPGWAEHYEAFDHVYQRRMGGVQSLRRQVAEVATERKRTEIQIAELQASEADPGGAGGGPGAGAELEHLRLRLAGLHSGERSLDEEAQEAQASLDAFRVRREYLKAAYLTAQTEIDIAGHLAALRQAAGEPPDEADSDASAARSRLRDITSEIERELGWPRPAEGLRELRTDPFGDGDIAILFAVEPPGTALLIAIADGNGTDPNQYAQAVSVASDVLRAVRAGEDPQASALAVGDLDAFLGRFFPGAAATEVAAGAAALAARIRGRTLAQQRAWLGLTEAEVAERMGVRQERVSAIERAAPGATEIRILAAYVEALGGQLEIVADFAGERVTLR